MYSVVEFSESHGGGMGIVRDQWLTPRKQECFWPPFKIAAKYNKCLLNPEPPNENWPLYTIKRTYYSTDDLLKARNKLKEAETESEIASDTDNLKKRKRKATRKFLDSSSEDDNCENERYVKRMTFPVVPPVTATITDQSESSLSLADTVIIQDINSCRSTPDNSETVLPSGVNDVDYSGAYEDLSVNDVTVASDITSSASTSSINGLAVVARHLAKIERRIEEIVIHQKILLENLAPSLKTHIEPLPAEIKLPCDKEDDVTNIEQWLDSSPENEKKLEILLSIVGGKKVQNVVRRILEKIFTNNLAKEYNWTGKHNKKALRDLKLITIIPKAVRRNSLTSMASDSDIRSTLQNWFRFVKDRDGGREHRRKAHAMDL